MSPTPSTILTMAVLIFGSALVLTTGISQTRSTTTQTQKVLSIARSDQHLPEVQLPQETRAEPIDIQPRPDENLNHYQARMDALFAPQLRTRGRDALIRDEASKYNQYLAILRYLEPRVFAMRGNLKIYLELERNYYANHRRAAIGNRPAAQPKARAKTVPAAALSSSNLWQELGNISKPTSNVGAEGTGPTKFVTFYNPSPSHMLCGSLLGGLFYSTNGGITWSKTGTDTEIGRSGVSTAAFQANDYKTWFVGSSGNGVYEPNWIGFDGGVFRTTDEGITWTQIAAQGQLGGIWTKIYKLETNPANPNQLFVATSNGLFTTTNATAASPSWTATPALSGKNVYDFERRPGNASWLYASVADWDSSSQTYINWRYMYSINNGSSWQNVPGQSAITSGASRLTIEVTPAKADNLYCLVTFGGSGQLYIYDWGANLWSLIYGSANIISDYAFGVDPADWKEIFLCEGTEARRYNYQSVPLFIDSHSTYPPWFGTFHPDIECLVPHPLNPNEVWMCNHGGMSVSFDNGQTWNDRSTGVGVAQTNRMATSPDPSYIALGLNHDGTDITTSQWSPLWSPGWKQLPLAFCDGNRPMIDPATPPQYMWHSCQWGQWFRSTDFGVTFSPNGPSSPAFIVEAAFNHMDSKIQYRLVDNCGFHTVMRTTDRGNTWDQIVDFQALYPSATKEYILWKVYTPETNGDYLIAHLLERPKGSQNWWTNHLYRTKIANDPTPANVIASWQELPLPFNMWLGDLKFDPANPDIVYIANSSSSIFTGSLTGTGMIFKVDYTNPAAHTYNVCTPGLCWDLTQNLPNATTGQDNLAVEQGSNGRIYFATDFGVYVSTNVTRALGGSGWTDISSNLPHTGFNGLQINYKIGKLRAGSFGRGVWEADLQTGCIEPPSDLVLWLPFDEPSGPTALNAGFASQGSHALSPTPLSAGEVDGALCFNVQNSHVDVPSYPAINFAIGHFSLDLWVRRNPGASGTEVLIDKRAGVNNATQIHGYSLFLFNGQIGLQLADGTFANYLSQPKVPDDGLWHHVAVTVNRSNSAGGHFYLDGVQVGPTFNPTNRPGSLSTAAPFRVGARSALVGAGAVSGGLNGCLDEVQAFRRVLSPDEVLAIYRAGHNGKCKQKCMLPPVTSFCTAGNTTTIGAQVCNFRPQVESFNYSFQGLPTQAGCSISGPTSFSPASGTITLASGQCQLVQTNITKPTGLTGSGITACYQILVQALSTQQTFSCGGTLDTWSMCNPSPQH